MRWVSHDKSTLDQPGGTKPLWHQAITWATIDQVLCPHMMSLGHNELSMRRIIFCFVLLWLGDVQFWPYPSGLLYWYWSNYDCVNAKQPHRIWANKSHESPGVGVTKALFINFSIMENFDLTKELVRYFQSFSYLSGVSAAQLRWHLSKMNVISYR